MCPEVLFHGEYVDKDWLNHWLQNPENQREVEELEAKEKAEEQEQKKQLQKQKRAASQLKQKKAEEYFHKYRQELGPDVVLSEESARILWRRAYNTVEDDLQHEEWLKRQAEERKRDEQEEKLRKEREEQERKRKEEYLAHLPEQQLSMFLTGTYGKWGDGCRKYPEFGHNRFCTAAYVEDIEPGLSLLK
jgi:hypothetical protein